jgi:hypothetical protein
MRLMNSIYVTIIYKMIKLYVGSDAYHRLETEVSLLVRNSVLTKEQKMTHVREFAVSELKLLVNKYLLKGIIEMIIARMLPNEMQSSASNVG